MPILYERRDAYIKRGQEWILTAEVLCSREPFEFYIRRDQLCDNELIEAIIRDNPTLDRKDFLQAVAIACRIFLKDKIEALPDRV